MSSAKVIPMFKSAVAPGAADAVKEVLESGMLGEGPKVEAFTEKLREHYGCKTVFPLNSGTSALTIALRLFYINHTSRVLTTPFTMVATSCAIAANGADCLWYDPSVDLTVMPGEIRDKIHRADALIVTLVGGMVPSSARLLEIRNICSNAGIPFIIDGAHAFNSRIGLDHIAKYCDIFCTSFQAIKHLNTGDGGAIVINDDVSDDIKEKAECLKWFGMTRIVPPGKTRLEHQMTADVKHWGYKAHMNDIAAAIGLANWDLAFENERISKRNAEAYQEDLSMVKGINLFDPYNSKTSSWWVYGFYASKRDQLIAHLDSKGIVSTPMWRRNDKYSAFQSERQKLTTMNEIAKSVVFIPNGFWVTEEDRQYIADSIKEFYK